MKTQTIYNLKEVRGGLYYHFGGASVLQNDLLRCCEDIVERGTLGRITLQVNMDGLALFKSSIKALWPILGRLIVPFHSEPFVIGWFCGTEKPQDIQDYLDDFVTAMSELAVNGVVIDGIKDPVYVDISCFM